MLLPVVALAKLGDTRAETEKSWGAPTETHKRKAENFKKLAQW